MDNQFKSAVDFVLDIEQGLVDDTEDPGGITNHGISMRFLAEVEPYATRLDIINMTEQKAIELFKEHFWDKCKCSGLPIGVDLVVFDCAVNQGPGTAIKILQRALGVTADGFIGPITLGALLAYDSRELIQDLCVRRAKKYALTKGIKRYGRGWYARLFDVFQEARRASF